MPARLSPLFSSASMRARDAAVKAVSPAEKKAERSEAEDHDQGGEPQIDGRVFGHVSSATLLSSVRNARRRSAAMPGAMKPCPMPRARMKVSAPPFTFLSWPHGVEKLVDGAGSRPGPRRGASAGRRPRRWASTRSASAAGQSPRDGGEAEGEAQSDGDGLAMDEPAGIVGRDPLERMAEGVAEVEERAVARPRARRGPPRRPWRGSSAPRPRRARGRRRRSRASSPRTRRRSARRRSGRTSPPRHSRPASRAPGSVSRSAVSARTRLGWWKAPTRFLP